MDEAKKLALKMKIERTMDNLRKNNMQAYYCETSEDACELVKKMLRSGSVISNGGSVTLKETGIMDIIKSGDFKYLDRSRPGITPDEVEQVYRDTYSADFYFASCNAITESGELYNVDGNSNRVSAILYGPKNVILVCGYNKIVKNLDEAIMRVKRCAAPPNTIRLNKETYCQRCGECLSVKSGTALDMPSGCTSDGRICCNYVVSAFQRHKDRINVIFIGEELGY